MVGRGKARPPPRPGPSSQPTACTLPGIDLPRLAHSARNLRATGEELNPTKSIGYDWSDPGSRRPSKALIGRDLAAAKVERLGRFFAGARKRLHFFVFLL